MISCIDIDECEEDSPCNEDENCVNAEGSYTCESKDEYKVSVKLYKWVPLRMLYLYLLLLLTIAISKCKNLSADCLELFTYPMTNYLNCLED